MLPALIGCGLTDSSEPKPLDAAALAAVAPKPGVPREKLARAVDALFTDVAADETRAVLVLYQGQIVAERYAPGYGKDTRFAGWSLSSSVVGALTGLLVSDGRLRLDETAPVPNWQRPGDPRGAITLRQLLQMRSGLRHHETADAGQPRYRSYQTRMLFLDGRDDMAAWAEAQPLEAVPGTRFEYSTASSVILADLAARALTTGADPALRRTAVSDYLHTRLLEPLGMKSAVPEFDAAGTLIGGAMMHATTRDWAKFGEFLRNGGAVKGAQIVPHGWIEFMTKPSPQNPAYGAQIWLNRPRPKGESVLFPDSAPQSLFAAVGHLGQYVIVSPRQQLTVVRLGKTDDTALAPVRERLADIVSLFPRS